LPTDLLTIDSLEFRQEIIDQICANFIASNIVASGFSKNIDKVNAFPNMKKEEAEDGT
jgi:hypothetical protein